MTRMLRLAGLHIALVAMVLRALLPAGWMPAPESGTPLVICTIDGAIHGHAKPGGPADPSDRDHQLCPFAAAVHLAIAVHAIALPTPRQFGRTVAPTQNFARGETRFAPYSSRAPPSFV
jgi:hypothetical protein